MLELLNRMTGNFANWSKMPTLVFSMKTVQFKNVKMPSLGKSRVTKQHAI